MRPAIYPRLIASAIAFVVGALAASPVAAAPAKSTLPHRPRAVHQILYDGGFTDCPALLRSFNSDKRYTELKSLEKIYLAARSYDISLNEISLFGIRWVLDEKDYRLARANIPIFNDGKNYYVYSLADILPFARSTKNGNSLAIYAESLAGNDRDGPYLSFKESYIYIDNQFDREILKPIYSYMKSRSKTHSSYFWLGPGVTYLPVKIGGDYFIFVYSNGRLVSGAGTIFKETIYIFSKLAPKKLSATTSNVVPPSSDALVTHCIFN